MVYEAVRKLVQYGLNTGLIKERDRIYARNMILDVLGLDEYEEAKDCPEEEGESSQKEAGSEGVVIR